MQDVAMNETEFRSRVQETFAKIDRAFSDVDPDIAECETGLGSLTITLADGSRCILSQQPSVRQLWMAVASRGIAFHFNWASARWMDDKGKGVELLAWLHQYLGEAARLDLKF